MKDDRRKMITPKNKDQKNIKAQPPPITSSKEQTTSQDFALQYHLQLYISVTDSKQLTIKDVTQYHKAQL